MILYRVAYLVLAEAIFKWLTFDICCEQFENIAMDDFVVPWQERGSVSVVIATHIAVASEPIGVVVGALSRAIESLQPRFATCCYLSAGDVTPGLLLVEILALADVMSPIRDAEGEFVGDWLPLSKTGAGELHRIVS